MREVGAGFPAGNSGISFSKEGLASAAGEFSDLQSKIDGEITKIVNSLEIIDSNWSGPEHDAASADKANAENNIQTARETIQNMNGALAQLSTNAGNVSYNG